jgi:hypothetical protein
MYVSTAKCETNASYAAVVRFVFISESEVNVSSAMAGQFAFISGNESIVKNVSQKSISHI